MILSLHVFLHLLIELAFRRMLKRRVVFERMNFLGNYFHRFVPFSCVYEHDVTGVVLVGHNTLSHVNSLLCWYTRSISLIHITGNQVNLCYLPGPRRDCNFCRGLYVFPDFVFLMSFRFGQWSLGSSPYFVLYYFFHTARKYMRAGSLGASIGSNPLIPTTVIRQNRSFHPVWIRLCRYYIKGLPSLFRCGPHSCPHSRQSGLSRRGVL